MALIQPDDLSKIREFFDSHLQNPVTIDLYTQPKSHLVVPGQAECLYCEETEQLLREVADVSDKITLDVHNVRENPQAGVAHGIAAADVPAFVLRGDNKGQVRYFGIPAGYEFANLLNGLAEVSSGQTKLSQDSLDELANLASDVHIRVFVTPG
ncbi:MAG TPA: thioredoxin family protein [Chloroflexota bacterium]|nr:thioredoxin family protein [Chloroflexota bacterium]